MPWNQKKPLSFRQRRAAKLLSVGWLRDGQVARIVGVQRETIWAWRQQPRFQAWLAQLERDFDSHIDYQRRALLEQALTALKDLIESPTPRVSLAALKVVLRVNGRLP